MNADPKPADVYSLAKTLWALAVDRKYPPPGRQSSTEVGLRVADLRPDARVELLDELIDRATLLRPETRPRMESIAAGLHTWLLLRATERKPRPATIDITELIGPLRAKLKAEIEAENTEEERRRLAQRAVDGLRDLSDPLDRALIALDARAEIGRIAHNLEGALHVVETLGSPRILFREEHVSSIRSGPEYFPFAATYGWGLDVDDNGIATLQTAVYVGHEEVSGTNYWWQGEPRKAEIGSVEMTRLAEETIRELGPKLREGLEAYETGLG